MGWRLAWCSGGFVVAGSAATAGAGFVAGPGILNVLDKRRFMIADPAADKQRAYIQAGGMEERT